MSGDRRREEERRGEEGRREQEARAGKWNAVKVMSAAKEEALIRRK